MNNLPNNNQTNMNVYTYLSQVRLSYSQYLQIRAQLTMLDNNLRTLNVGFDTFPTQPNLSAVQNAWSQKFMLMQQILQIMTTIISNLTEATRLVLSSMQQSIATGNKLSTILNDNDIASICSIVEQNLHQLQIKELYKQNCIALNIHIQLSDIEIRAQMMGISIPNLDHLKTIIRGY
ncbi:MAG: hypothetical protein K2M96_01430 [Prevotella sp.]|nr:hypothetical protein [Prevotella sp.]